VRARTISARRLRATALFVLSTLALASCSEDNDPAPDQGDVAGPVQPPGTPPDGSPGTPPGTPPGTVDDPDEVFPATASDLEVVRSVYSQDGYGTVDVQRFDVRTVTSPGVCVKGDESGCTLADVLADIDPRDDFKVDIPVHFSAADFPEDGLDSNAELRQRGGGARLAPQKSFRLRFEDKDAIWRGERRLLLNKHPYESTRIRNKLAMDLMAEVPHLESFRTQFVNLFIDDGAGLVDQGLYTHIEGPGGRYLERRGLNDDDRLYKANSFTFSAFDLLQIGVDEQGEPLDEDLFEDLIEVENGEDHRPLVKMMEALHDPSRSFESVLDEHFNRNNVLTWLAMNILVHQTDAVRHNYILHNPVGTERFYFVPWDYDMTFDVNEEPGQDFSNASLRARLAYGYAANAGNEFVDRFYRLPGTHERILAVAEWLRANHVTDANVDEKARGYAALVAPYQTRAPDSAYNPAYLESAVTQFADYVGQNMEALRTRFSMPLPPTALPVRREGEQVVFSWTPGYDVTGGRITHEAQLSASPGFEPDTLIAQDVGLPASGPGGAQTAVEWRVDALRLPPGTNYLRVIARSVDRPERDWQVVSNRTVVGNTTYRGVMAFTTP